MVVVESSRRVYHGSATMFSMRHRSAPENDRFPVVLCCCCCCGKFKCFCAGDGNFRMLPEGRAALSPWKESTL